MTENERIWQWLDEHWDQFLEYWQTKTKDLSQADVVAFDADRIVGIMADWVYQGVRKVVMVTPQSLVEGLTRLNEEIRRRCEIAATAAENAASYATTEGNYARSQGDRMAQYIQDITELKERVRQQGNTAEAQGARAQQIYENVSAWYNPFRDEAEDWYANEVRAWNIFKGGAQEDFAAWTSAENVRKQNENTRILQENTRVGNEGQRQTSEQQRRDAETIRDNNEDERLLNELGRIENERRRESAEGLRQQTFEANEVQRQQTFEDGEDRRMQTLLLTRFYINPKTKKAYAIKPKNDTNNYKIRRGKMFMIITKK